MDVDILRNFPCRNASKCNILDTYSTYTGHPAVDSLISCLCGGHFLGEEEVNFVISRVIIIRNHHGTNKLGLWEGGQKKYVSVANDNKIVLSGIGQALYMDRLERIYQSSRETAAESCYSCGINIWPMAFKQDLLKYHMFCYSVSLPIRNPVKYSCISICAVLKEWYTAHAYIYFLMDAFFIDRHTPH